ncbi:hypothetical protein TCDM_10180 [Trypanosoma cruzi Dm28c]|uniref:Uncharacterized protein n=1 Tax=Trypanosoma cruzi Dm28c TaxID=1416333 RepID=V5B858_TRYCR|nr:hypothetical protein TCDM_10180 [Trypanosoma cruzi Dm28c]
MHTKSKKIPKKRQGVAVCVALRVSASPERKENKTRGKEMCAPPHRPSSHAHTSRLPQRAVRRGPPHACSRRGAQGRRHERVGGVRVEQLGGKHTAPLTGRVQKKQLKENSKKEKRP